MTTFATLGFLALLLVALLPLRGGASIDRPQLHHPPSRGWLEAHGLHFPIRRRRPTR